MYIFEFREKIEEEKKKKKIFRIFTPSGSDFVKEITLRKKKSQNTLSVCLLLCVFILKKSINSNKTT